MASRQQTVDTTIAARDGGPEVVATDVPECDGIVTDDFLHNGYRAGQYFYPLMTDASMDGAQFEAPETLLFIDDTTAADHDRAVVNLRYTTRAGASGNLITVARKSAGSATAGFASDWWLAGNQRPVDVSVQAVIRRNEQLAPNPGQGVFANASASRYESGLSLFVNKDGPGSAGLRAARIKGAGLPPAGIVLTRPNPTVCSNQNWLDILRKDGNTDPAAAGFAAATGTIFRVQRSRGLSGTDATTERPNPNAGNGNNTAFPNWAHPLDYGAAAGSTGYIDFGALGAMTPYTVEIFYDGELAPRHTFTALRLTPVVQATAAASLPWVDLDSATRAYLDPANALAGAVPSIELSWTAPAQALRSAGVYTSDGATTVNNGTVAIERGATRAIATAPGAGAGCAAGDTFAPLAADGRSYRSIQLRYRMQDGSFKDSVTRFN